MGKNTYIYLYLPEVKIKLKHWTGPTMVDSFLCLLYVTLVCVSVSFFCICLRISSQVSQGFP